MKNIAKYFGLSFSELLYFIERLKKEIYSIQMIQGLTLYLNEKCFVY